MLEVIKVVASIAVLVCACGVIVECIKLLRE